MWVLKLPHLFHYAPILTLPPIPLLFITQPLQLSLSFTPKETRSCLLLHKEVCFEGAAVLTPPKKPFERKLIVAYCHAAEEAR